MTNRVTQTRNHWWWRPGWKQGRALYTWHITFADQPLLHEFATRYAPVLDSLPMLDRIPVQWLHMTMQGVGFTDEVDRSDIDRIVDAARARCALLEPTPANLGPVWVDAEALLLPARPVEALTRVRSTVREAIADVWGADRVPEAPDGWIPHVSLAYSNAAGPTEPIFQALASLTKETTQLQVSAVSLIEINRDHKMYEWRDVARVTLGHS